MKALNDNTQHRQAKASTFYFAKEALLADGWAKDVLFEVREGMFHDITPNSMALSTTVLAKTVRPTSVIELCGPVLSTLANVHSHAFQRVMAGAAEVSLNPNDSFWSWRDLMYKIVQKLTPDQARIIATQLYIDMLKAGYSQVGEFHYLHHAPAGQGYQNKAEMSQQLLNAANASGIGMTLLPVMYSHSGFGGQAPTADQARFINSTDGYLALHDACETMIGDHSRHRLGICFHSLRAVTENQIQTILHTLKNQQPIHIHIAEQQKEVADCLQWCRQRPVEWLYDHVAVDERWCLVHATHLSQHEMKQIAQSNAVVGVCPTTEANLGDGIFPGVDFESIGGRWGIGSDSHVSLSIVEELRTFEYSQRLRDQQRNRLYGIATPRVGDHLFHQALSGGNQACDVLLGLCVGHRADFMVLDHQHPFMAASQAQDKLNRWLFACNENLIKDVYVEGVQVIRNGRHSLDEQSQAAFTQVLREVMYGI